MMVQTWAQTTQVFQALKNALGVKLLAGDSGYNRLVCAAVVGDTLLACMPCLRLEDEAAADFALSGPAAAELQMRLRALLVDGGLFLAEASESMTHTVLRAIQGRIVFVKAGTPDAGAVCLRWPAPGPGRSAPIARAKESLCIYVSVLVALFRTGV